MTTGLISSSANPSTQITSATEQDTLNTSTTISSAQTGKLESFALFCLQHPDFLKLVVQLFLTVVILSFSIFQLANGGRDGQGKNDALYWGCVTSILAWWMPSPAGYPSGNQPNPLGTMNGETTVASSHSSSRRSNRAFRKS